MTPPRPPIVCFSNLDWGYLRYRKQQLMTRLVREFDVVYVNPPRAIKASNPAIWNRVSRVDERLWVLDPIVLPGVRRSPWVKRMNDRLIARAIERIPTIRRPPIAWAYSPHARSLVDLVSPGFVVYDVADNYATPGGAAIRDAREADEIARLASLEEAMLRRADLVVCVSEPLAARAGELHRNVHVVPNGCDFALHDEPRPPAITARPRIGYVGSIAPRVDTELIVELARRRPEWEVEIVGPVSPLVQLQHAMPLNLRWAGEVPYECVPSLMAGFDVGILPLREIPFATDCSPIQVFDYLAAGKPVVSTPVAQLAKWPSLVTIARGVDAFVSAIDTALRNDNSDSVAGRRAFARENSWDRRTDRLIELLEASGACGAAAAAA